MDARFEGAVGGLWEVGQAAGRHFPFGQGSEPKVLTGSEKGYPFLGVLEHESGPSHWVGSIPGIAAGVEFHCFARARLVFHGGLVRPTGPSENGGCVDV